MHFRRRSGKLRARIAGVAGVLLIMGGGAAIGVAASAQEHAPSPSRASAGIIGPAHSSGHGGNASAGSAGGQRSLPRSEPVSIDIPAIGVRSNLLHLGLNPNGTIQVPPLFARPSEAAWYRYSATPGQIGASVIEGHVDTYQGPSVFYRLGALKPGNKVDVTLADGTVAVFRVTGIRQYLKADFPTKTVYGPTSYAALHLVTCGGAFDWATHHYLSNLVVFASLVSSRTVQSQ